MSLACVDCADVLVRCGYTHQTARKRTQEYVKSNRIASKRPTVVDMASLLRYLVEEGSRRGGRQLPLVRQELAQLERTASLPAESPAPAPLPDDGDAAAGVVDPASVATHANDLHSNCDSPDTGESVDDSDSEPEPAPVQRATDADELCTLLGVSQALRVRTLGQGASKLFSLVDAARLLSEKTSAHAARDVNQVFGIATGAKFVMNQKVVHDEFQVEFREFPGSNQEAIPMGNLKTTLYMAIHLPSRKARRLTSRIIDVFVRYVGGCPMLAQETLNNRKWQEYLAREEPEHPARVFGETVEQESRVPPPPTPQEIWRTPAPQGIGNWDNTHYVLGSRTYPDMCKTGHTTQSMDERLKKINSQQNKDLGLYVMLVYHHEGPLEQRVRCKLDAWGCRRPPAEYGVNGSEFRVVHVDTVREAIEEVRRECASEAAPDEEAQWLRKRRNEIEMEELELQCAAKRLKLDKEKLELEFRKLELDWARHAYALGNDVEQWCKRRRLHLQVDREELELEQAKFNLLKQKDAHHLEVDAHKITLERERLHLAMEQLELEKAKRSYGLE